MSFRSNKLWSALAVVAALLLSVAGLSSPAAALTARTLTITVSPAYQYGAKPVTFSGSVTKSPTGSVVKIQRKSGTSWVAAGQTTTTSAGGAYSVVLNTPTTPAAYAYRALAPKTATLAGVYSTRTVTVTVVRKTTATLTIAPTSILTGASASFTGSVTPFAAGTTVTIQRQSGASWVTAGTAVLSAGGTYATNVTPAGPGTFTYRTMSPLNGLNAGTTSLTKTLTVTNPDAPVITTTSLPDGDQGLPYSTTLTKTGDDGTWSIPPATLPGGLSLNGTTGVLSGTPTGSGSRNLSVTFTATGSGLAANKSLPITINPGPAITTATLPVATQGVAYTTTLTKTGRVGTWSIQGLPAGLTINADTGVISGTTNAAAGDYGVYPTYTETVGGRSVLKALALHVNAGQVTPPDGPTITTTTLPDGDQGLPYSTTLTHTGGTGTWAIAPGPTLKPGLTLNPSTGVISGTPTGNSSSNFTVSFTETSSGLTAYKALTIYITPLPTISTTTLPDATRGAAYTATLAKTGKAGTWSIQNLPAGLTINADTGVISGTTYAAVGDYGVYPTFTETVGGRSVLKALALHIGGVPLEITTDPTLPDGHKNAAYSVTFTKTGGDGTWGVVQIPDGFSLNPTTGTLTGTPQVAGLYAVYVTFTETGGGSVMKGFSLKVVQPKITTTSIPDGVTGTAYSQQLTKTGLDGTWEVLGLLPDAITFSAAGLLAGTPTETGDFQLLIKFTETSTGVSSQQFFILHVAAPGSPTITTASLPNGTIGTPYSATLAATPTGGTWSITDGSLPVGLSLNAATGAITGTPIVAEDARFIVTYTKGATQNTKYLRLLVP